MSSKFNVKISRYANPRAHGWVGTMEPEDRTWIAFIGLDGAPRFFLHRDPVTGAILGHDPAEHAADIAAIRAEGGLRTGMRNDGSAQWPEGERDPLEIGEVVYPLGVSGSGRDVEPMRA